MLRPLRPRPRPLTLLLMTALLALAPLAGAEGPLSGTCDPTGLLVCAGADAGAAVQCTLSGASAGCTWTRGAVWAAFSRAGLPGEATLAHAGTVQQCLSGAGCATVPSASAAACTFVGPVGCEGNALESGGVGPVTLAMGQCLTVTVTRTATIDARVPAGLPALATASWTSTGSDAGQVCRVDDGRGG